MTPRIPLFKRPAPFVCESTLRGTSLTHKPAAGGGKRWAILLSQKVCRANGTTREVTFGRTRSVTRTQKHKHTQTYAHTETQTSKHRHMEMNRHSHTHTRMHACQIASWHARVQRTPAERCGKQPGSGFHQRQDPNKSSDVGLEFLRQQLTGSWSVGYLVRYVNIA